MRRIATRVYDWGGVNDAADRLFRKGRSYMLQLSELAYGTTPPRIMSEAEVAEWLDDCPEQIIAA